MASEEGPIKVLQKEGEKLKGVMKPILESSYYQN